MRDPDKLGVAGKAWMFHPMDVSVPGFLPTWKSCIVQYLLNIKGAHACWDHWVLCLISLRTIEGVPDPHKAYPEAQYEIMIVALDPKAPIPDPDSKNPQELHYLTPVDLSHQFHGVTDGQAVEIADTMTSLMVRGVASPDQDYRSFWVECIDKTVENMSKEKPKVQ